MKRIHPLILIVTIVLLFAGGLLWKITSASQCMGDGGTVIGPMTRSQGCATAGSGNLR